MKLIEDFPFSMFVQAISSALGRALVFFATCFAALFFLTLTTALAGGEALSLPELLWLPVGIPIVWVTQAVQGIFQVWGILSYGILAILYVFLVREEKPASRMLPAAFLLQWLETLRCASQAGGWEAVSTPRFVVSLGIWAALCAAWIVFLVRTRVRKPLLS